MCLAVMKRWFAFPSFAKAMVLVGLVFKRSVLAFAERSYFRTTCDLGYNEEEAHRWTAAVILHLRDN
jgi:hypothetical protein